MLHLLRIQKIQKTFKIFNVAYFLKSIWELTAFSITGLLKLDDKEVFVNFKIYLRNIVHKIDKHNGHLFT